MAVELVPTISKVLNDILATDEKTLLTLEQATALDKLMSEIASWNTADHFASTVSGLQFQYGIQQPREGRWPAVCSSDFVKGNR